MKPTLEIQYGDRVEITVPVTAPMSWAGHALESAYLWFFGRGMFNVMCAYRKYHVPYEHARFTLDSINKWQGMYASGFATTGMMMQNGRMPHILAREWEPKEGELLVEYVTMKTDVPLVQLGYSLADLSLDLFKRGAKVVRAQYSMHKSQVAADVDMTPAQLAEFNDNRVPSYQPGDDIGTLP